MKDFVCHLTGGDGGSERHFSVEIEAEAFAGKSRVDRQRAVNAALGNMLEGGVHALAVRATAPGE